MLAQTGGEGVETLTRLLNDSYGWIIDLIEKEGGDVVLFSGDALTAVFPATDEAIGIATRRAQQAGQAIQKAMLTRGRIQTETNDVVLNIKVIIGAGDVLAMQVGGIRSRWEYVVAGAPFEQIAQLEREIQKGELRLSPEAQLVMVPDIIPPRPFALPDFHTIANPADVRNILLHYIPGAVQNWLAESLHDWIGVLRPMSVLFVKINGLNYESVETAVAKMQQFFKGAQQTVYHYEGSVNKLAVDDKGTIFIVLLGAPPFAHEDDPWRAVRCAQDLQQVAHSHGLQLTIGITTGRVFSGLIGSQSRREYTAMGDAMNLAARLMAYGQVGDIHCDFDTYRHVREQIHMEALPPIHVRGKAGQIRIYRPTNSMGATPITTDHHLFVGRTTELNQLHDALDEVILGYGRILVVKGEAGIGKTHLVNEIIKAIKEKGIAGLRGTGHSIESQLSYWIWRDIFISFFDLEDVFDIVKRRQIVSRTVQELLPEFSERIPLLNDVLDLGFSHNALTANLQGQSRHTSLTGLLIALLQKWMEEQPLILVLEDAHWLDSLSWDLTRQIAHAFTEEPYPLFLIIVMRPLPITASKVAPLEDLYKLPQTRQIQLQSLNAQETEALAAARLGLPGYALPAHIAELIYNRSGGNPFFVEELVYALQDREILHLQPGTDSEAPQLHVTGDLNQTAHTLPDTLQGIALSRIDRLTPEQQLTLKVASVIGRNFTYKTLYNTLHQYTNITELLLQEHLNHFIERELITIQMVESEQTYLFKHLMTREVAYSTLLHTQRRQLHRTVAKWYELRFDDSTNIITITRLYPLLVHHWHEAGDTERERYYSRLAGLRAANQYANEEALVYLNRALTLTLAEAHKEQFELLLTREQIHFHQSKRKAQARDLEALTKLAKTLNDHKARAQVAWRLARMSELVGNYETAEQAARKAVNWGQLAGDSISEIEGYNQWAKA